MKKSYNIILLYTIIVFISTSCDSFLDVNNNEDSPEHVEAELYLPGICASFGEIYYDIRAIAPMIQMMGTTSYTNFAKHYYYTNSDAGGQVWRMVYWSHGTNLENLINQSIEKREYAFAAIGLIIKAYDWDLLTKLHGEAPFKEAYKSGLLSHKYDSQKDIYKAVRGMAYKAIKYIETEESDMKKYGTRISSSDYIYHGDMVKWKKFAYAVLAKNYISLSNKKDFVSSGFADSVIYCANLSFASTSDDATAECAPESEVNTSYLNFWGPARRNLSNLYFQHEYAVQIMSGTVPLYDETTGDKYLSNIDELVESRIYPYELNPNQIICDTIRSKEGHFDPRIILLCGNTNKRYAEYKTEDSITIKLIPIDPGKTKYDTIKVPVIKYFLTEKSYIKNYLSKRYYGGASTSQIGPIERAATYYGRTSTEASNIAKDGYGRWLYRDDAPYILSTCAEIKFDKAEAYWKKDDKASALRSFKEAIEAHMAFCEKYITLPTAELGGDKITKETFKQLEEEYLKGPYVNKLGTDKISLSHIMMQKWIALYPWGAIEAFVDMRKYHWDIKYTGEYPKKNNGWTENQLAQKYDSDESKIYKGFFLLPAQVQGRKVSFNVDNEGSPCYRIRPRYNSEYMWNLPSLKTIKPTAGNAPNYQCSIPWFAYPEEMPESI